MLLILGYVVGEKILNEVPRITTSPQEKNDLQWSFHYPSQNDYAILKQLPITYDAIDV